MSHFSSYLQRQDFFDLNIRINLKTKGSLKRAKDFLTHRLFASYHSSFLKEHLLVLSNEVSFDGIWHLDINISDESEFNVFDKVVLYMHGVNINPKKEDALGILTLSKKLKILKLEDQILDYLLEDLNRNNAVLMLLKAVQNNVGKLVEKCIDTIALHFDVCISRQRDEIFSLPPHIYIKLVSHPQLFVDYEYGLYEVICNYIENNQDVSGDHIDSLFKTVRFPYMTFQELEKVLHDNTVPKDILSRSLVFRLSFHESSILIANTTLASNLTKREISITFEHKSDFDNNGLLYYLSTNRGTSEWKNPSLTGSIKVSSSSIEKGKLHNIVDINPNECWTMQIPSSWFALDLRQGKLVLMSYTLRHGGSTKMDCLRNWTLQASEDGQGWIDIMRHTNDTSLNAEFATHTWKAINPKLIAYRHFRVLQTGHNSGNNNFLCLSGIELYGLFYPNNKGDKKGQNNVLHTRNAAVPNVQLYY